MLGRKWLGLFLIAFIFASVVGSVAFAQNAQPSIQAASSGTTATTVHANTSVLNLPDTFWPGVVGSLVYGGVGIVLAMLAFIVFELVTRSLHVQDQLSKGNVAVGIVVGALIFGAFYLAAVAIH